MTAAIDAWRLGQLGRSTTAMTDYQTTRDAQSLPMYDFTCQLATLEPPPPEMQQLLGAVHGNQDAMDGFAGVNAGVTVAARVLRRRERRPHLRRGRGAGATPGGGSAPPRGVSRQRCGIRIASTLSMLGGLARCSSKPAARARAMSAACA